MPYPLRLPFHPEVSWTRALATGGWVATLPVATRSRAREYVRAIFAHSIGWDPVFLVAQQALESGRWGFPGLVPASFHNPLGLKVPKPEPEDRDPARVFAQLASPTHAAIAQVIHWRAYTGEELSPLERAADPRAEAVIQWGTKTRYDPTTEDIGGGVWATDPQYGTKIERLMEDILSHC